jgi:pyridinium-3,5-biscarboxylic acid mononucleotide sulfurtransferase
MTRELKKKYSILQQNIKKLSSAVVAFSGGVDSTLLLKICKDELKENAYAIMGVTQTMPEEERNMALQLARSIGVEPILIETQELNSKVFCANPDDRCYHCKSLIFGSFQKYLEEKNLYNLLDGSNINDLSDYRPGKKALEELNVISPFIEAGFTKNEIRELSKQLDLPTWDKEALACLATRIAFGDEITAEKLDMINKAEKFLRDKGFTYVRARIQKNQLRIETSIEQLPVLFEDEMRKEVVKYMKELGFKFVTIDMEGYRMGSMNN